MADLAAASLTFSVLSFVVITIGLLLWTFPDLKNTVQFGISSQQTSGLTTVAALGGAFAPDIALLTGFISDIMNGSFRYSVTSLVGIISVILNWLIGKVFSMSAPSISLPSLPSLPKLDIPLKTPQYIGVGAPLMGGGDANFNPCAIRGLGMFDTAGSPMGLAALGSIFMIYFLDMVVNKKRMPAEIGGYAVFSAAVFALNSFSYKEYSCIAETSIAGILKASALPLAIGLGVGGISFATMNASYPGFLPLDAHAINSDPQTSNQAKCGKPNDQDQFVCDAYKDGKRISTSTVV